MTNRANIKVMVYADARMDHQIALYAETANPIHLGQVIELSRRIHEAACREARRTKQEHLVKPSFKNEMRKAVWDANKPILRRDVTMKKIVLDKNSAAIT